MNIKFNFLLIITLFFISCSNVEDKNDLKSNHLDFVQDYEFKTGMSTRRKHLGVYYDKQKKQEYLYFGNVVTDKVIKIFSFENTLKWKIPLDKVTEEETIEDFSIISPDTIIVLSQYTNKMFFINRKGDIWKKISLDTLIKHPTGDHYEFCTSTYSEINVDDYNIILGVDWRNKAKDDEQKTFLNEIKYYYYNIWNSDKYLQINFKDNYDILDYTFGCNLYKTLFPNDSIVDFTELSNYYIANGEIYVYSVYSNKVLTLDSENFSIKNTTPIESQQSPIGANLIPINEKTILDLQDLTLKNVRSSGLINRIFFDTQNKIYYIVVLKQISYDFYLKNKYRPRILLIFDNEFKKLEEIKLPRSKNGFVISTNKGLLIGKTANNKSDNIDYFDQKIIFSLYKYHE